MAHPYWPLFDLRVRTPRIELRPPTDDDLLAIVDLVRRGVHDPADMPFSNPWTDQPSPDLERGALQWAWGQRAGWKPDDWGLGMAVWLLEPEPHIVGVQDLFAKNFALTRTAESGSWLGLAHQGQGIGKEMRAAILHLAFAGLGAEWALTYAWDDNPASIGVTTRLGYEPNGVEIDLRRGQPTSMRAFRMGRAQWEERRRRDIRIEGLEHCLDLFGLPQPVAGADACAGGWCVVTLPVEGPATVEVVERFAPLAARRAKGQVGAIGVDIPIGLSDGPPRRCDVEARTLLGERRSSVFPAPVRPVLGARSYEAAQDRTRAATGKGLSKQSWHLVPRIAEVDRALDPTRQGRIFECHPELAFAGLRGTPMTHTKKTAAGREERLAVLRRHVDGIDALVARPPRGAGADDVLDAAVCAVTAKALLAGKVRRLGERRHDAKGLVMEMVLPALGPLP